MPGHGSPPPEDRGDYPQRKASPQEQRQAVKAARPTSRRAMFTPQWQIGTQPMPEPGPWKQRLKALGRE